MDFGNLLNLGKEYLLPHWPLLVMAFLLGTVGQFFKTRVWTKERAAKSRVMWWIRAALPLHAPMVGALVALFGKLIFGTMPASLGAESYPDLMLYYAGAGAVAAYFVALLKHIAKSRGIQLSPVSMPPPPDDEDAPDTKRTGDSGNEPPQVA